MTIDAAAVITAQPESQPTGERYCELVMTGAIVAGLTPLQRRDVAAFVRGILGRAPVSTAASYEPVRSVLGGLLLELETFALIEPMDPLRDVEAADLRDPATVAREREAIRQFSEWQAHELVVRAAAYEAHVDELLLQSAVGREQVWDELQATAERVQALVDAPPAAEEPQEVPSWL